MEMFVVGQQGSIKHTLLILIYLAGLSSGDWGWIVYDCVSPDGVSPSVTCKYSDQTSNYIDVSAVDFWCCHKEIKNSNITKVSCPSSTDYKCLSWDGTGVKADVDPNTVASTYMPPSSDGLRLSSKLLIAGGCLIVVAVLSGLGIYFCMRKKKRGEDRIQNPVSLKSNPQPTVSTDVNTNNPLIGAP